MKANVQKHRGTIYVTSPSENHSTYRHLSWQVTQKGTFSGTESSSSRYAIPNYGSMKSRSLQTSQPICRRLHEGVACTTPGLFFLSAFFSVSPLSLVMGYFRPDSHVHHDMIQTLILKLGTHSTRPIVTCQKQWCRCLLLLCRAVASLSVTRLFFCICVKIQ